jgi:hypothetical protein
VSGDNLRQPLRKGPQFVPDTDVQLVGANLIGQVRVTGTVSAIAIGPTGIGTIGVRST